MCNFIPVFKLLFPKGKLNPFSKSLVPSESEQNRQTYDGTCTAEKKLTPTIGDP